MFFACLLTCYIVIISLFQVDDQHNFDGDETKMLCLCIQQYDVFEENDAKCGIALGLVLTEQNLVYG